MVSNNFQQSNGKDFVIYPFEEKFTKGASYDLSLKEISCISDEKINIKDLLVQNLHKLPDYIKSLLLAGKTIDDNAIKIVTDNYFIILPYQRPASFSRNKRTRLAIKIFNWNTPRKGNISS